MDYTKIMNDKSGKKARVGIVGATKGYGYTLLAQIPNVKLMELRAICTRHPEECLAVLKEIGYPEDKIVVCENKADIDAAAEDTIIVVKDYRLVMECGITAMVECTGNTAVSTDAAIIALKKGINVYMVSKETDSVCGPILNQIAADLVAEGVDVIIPIATPAAMIMQNATEDNQIPVVFSAVSDPVGAGLVASADAPGANITGTSDAIDVAQIMDFILAADPDAAKIGFLYDKSQDSSTSAIQAAKDYCDEHGISYVEKTGTTTGEIQAAADSLVAEKVDAIFTPQDNTVMTAELAIFEKFADAGIPHYTSADSFALNGAFLGYGVNYETLGTKTADMVADILANGADPATTPVETLDSGIVTVNTEIAEKVGIDYSIFKDMCSELIETVTAEEFN